MEENKELGRPSKYKEEYNELAYKICLLGATDVELADIFNVSEQTINTWKIKHKGFSLALKKGKTMADANVAEKLYHKATGYQHEDVDIKIYEGNIIKTPIIKYYAPDTTAAIFWLKNRQPSRWRDKQEVDTKISVKSIELKDLVRFE